MNQAHGIVYLVGAGPGDPGLITVRGLELLRRADVVLHDRLAPHELLSEIRPQAEVLDVGKARGSHKATQAKIDAILIDRARCGKTVVRLKGGDPFIFGRGYEEFVACRDAEVECVVIPGVSSVWAGPAAAGIPLTQRLCARSMAVVTATAASECARGQLDFGALSRIDTVVVLMGRKKLRWFAESLITAGRDPTTPVACIERATTPQQRVTVATLESIADAADRDGLKPPVVTVVGAVAAHATDNHLAVGSGDRRHPSGPMTG